MIKITGALMIILTYHVMFSSAVLSQTRERESVPEKYTWRLEDIFTDDQSWEQAKTDLVSKMDRITSYRGRLTSSAATLLECLQFGSDLSMEFTRLFNYASMKSDQDTRNSTYQAMKQEISQIATDFAAKAAFLEPELVKMTKKQVDQFVTQEPGLEHYRLYLDDILRRKAHKLSEKEEKILAQAGMMAQAPYNIFSIFTNAELPYPEATLTDGQVVKLDQAGYSRFRRLPNREDRIIVFNTFWDAMNKFRNTIGAELFAEMKKDVFYARCRNYDSSLQAALDVNNIPVAVYHTLIKNVNDNLDTFHRYLKLRQRMLGVDTLKYYDLYAPVVKGVDLEYDIDQAWDIVLKAMAPMGKEYEDVLKRAREERWIDVYPTPGKRSGAYSNDGGYDIHPYMLLNYNGKYSDVSTLAHELGHSLHTYFSNKNQPYPLADYSIFVAEVASTFNEALLTHYILNTIKDDDARLSLLMEYLDGIKGTVFRQTQFAEFELAIHDAVEKGQALTGDNLTTIYGDILKKYYGQDKGVCDIDDNILVEWTYIPHFYYDYYVYQYATSFTASTALAQRVIDGKKGAVRNMIEFLSAGGSDYPIDVLKKAGIDMTSPKPFRLTMEAMNNTMDEIERILDRKGL